MTTKERIDLLYDAADATREAISLIRQATRGTSVEGNTEAYIVPHLRSWIDNNRSGGMSIDQIIKKLDEDVGFEDDK